jgi:hypothetical protein
MQPSWWVGSTELRLVTVFLHFPLSPCVLAVVLGWMHDLLCHALGGPFCGILLERLRAVFCFVFVFFFLFKFFPF